MRTLRGVSGALCGRAPAGNVQDGHEYGKPQLLGADQSVGVGLPLPGCAVVGVAQDDEDPGRLGVGVSVVPTVMGRDTYGEAKPTDKTMMLLEYIMMVTRERQCRLGQDPGYRRLGALTCEPKGRR